MNTTLTFEEGTSSKFYSLTLEDKVLTIRFGRIGTGGQEKTTRFRTAEEARQQYDALLAEKLKKGYVEPAGAKPAAAASGEGSPRAAARKRPAAAPAAPAEDPPLPAPALEDPPAAGLDLTVFRGGPIPVPEPDSAPLETGDLVIQGYTVSFGDDGEVIITDARKKVLRSVPDKLRKDEDYQALMRGRKDDRARERRARRVLEERMISGAPISAGEIAWLVDDDAFAPSLKGVLVAPAGGADASGLLVSWDRDKGLGLLPLDYDARWIGWTDVEIVHPMKLGDALPWQDLLIDLGVQQGLAQIFREVKSVPAAQRSLTESSMLSGRETRSAAVIERALGEEGWTTRRGMARRKLSLRGDPTSGSPGMTVEAWFDYGECYMPSDPTTTGAFGFWAAGTRAPLKLSAVPGVLLSETIRSLDVALAQAGAKKDEDEEGEGAEGEGDEDGGEDSGDEP